ncbi:MAG: metallophosphoesterase [Deltaproteobacteria bacterium]|nr:metallophosphoesterase [Deltaproteobacteria bacterium]
MNSDTRTPRAASKFSAMDWIGVVVTGLAAFSVMLVPRIVAPPIVSMYEDFDATLPTITLLVISGWFPLLLGQLPLASLLLALLRRHSMSAARMLVVIGFVLALVFGAVCWYGLYAPIFELAGAVSNSEEPPERIVAIGDLHGDLAATRRALRLAGAIDDQDRWIGGDLLLIQTGDTIDRGDQDREVLDLLERLIESAPHSGGAVIALNGNHELMNAAGDMRYITPRAMAGFDDLGGRAKAFEPGSEYALRFSEQDVIVKIGDTVFAHGAVLPHHVEYGIERLNREVRAWLRSDRSELPAIMKSEDAPVWDRRFSDEAKESDCAVLERTLTMLNASRLVVGHEAQEKGITSACDDKVWRIDVGMSAFYGGPTEVLEIRGDDVRVLGR